HVDLVQPGRPDRARRGVRAAARDRRARGEARRRRDDDRESLRQHGSLRPYPAAAACTGRTGTDDRLRPRAAGVRMIRINLLPHREQRRQARQRQFVSLSIGLAIMGLALVALGWVVLSTQIESQEGRNTLLKNEIAK